MVTASVSGASLRPWQLIPGLFLLGIAQGWIIPPLFHFILSDVPGDEAGAASGVLSTSQQVANAVGVAVVGVVFLRLLGSDQSPSSYVDAYRTAQVYNLVLAVSVLVFIPLLPRRPAGLEPAVATADAVPALAPALVTEGVSNGGTNRLA